jgi:serine/threonine protein kinase
VGAGEPTRKEDMPWLKPYPLALSTCWGLNHSVLSTSLTNDKTFTNLVAVCHSYLSDMSAMEAELGSVLASDYFVSVLSESNQDSSKGFQRFVDDKYKASLVNGIPSLFTEDVASTGDGAISSPSWLIDRVSSAIGDNDSDNSHVEMIVHKKGSTIQGKPCVVSAAATNTTFSIDRSSCWEVDSIWGRFLRTKDTRCFIELQSRLEFTKTTDSLFKTKNTRCFSSSARPINEYTLSYAYDALSGPHAFQLAIGTIVSLLQDRSVVAWLTPQSLQVILQLFGSATVHRTGLTGSVNICLKNIFHSFCGRIPRSVGGVAPVRISDVVLVHLHRVSAYLRSNRATALSLPRCSNMSAGRKLFIESPSGLPRQTAVVTWRVVLRGGYGVSLVFDPRSSLTTGASYLDIFADESCSTQLGRRLTGTGFGTVTLPGVEIFWMKLTVGSKQGGKDGDWGFKATVEAMDRHAYLVNATTACRSDEVVPVVMTTWLQDEALFSPTKQQVDGIWLCLVQHSLWTVSFAEDIFAASVYLTLKSCIWLLASSKPGAVEGSVIGAIVCTLYDALTSVVISSSLLREDVLRLVDQIYPLLENNSQCGDTVRDMFGEVSRFVKAYYTSDKLMDLKDDKFSGSICLLDPTGQLSLTIPLQAADEDAALTTRSPGESSSLGTSLSAVSQFGSVQRRAVRSWDRDLCMYCVEDKDNTHSLRFQPEGDACTRGIAVTRIFNESQATMLSDDQRKLLTLELIIMSPKAEIGFICDFSTNTLLNEKRCAKACWDGKTIKIAPAWGIDFDEPVEQDCAIDGAEEFTAGEVCQVVFDFTNKKMSFLRNGEKVRFNEGYRYGDDLSLESVVVENSWDFRVFAFLYEGSNLVVLDSGGTQADDKNHAMQPVPAADPVSARQQEEENILKDTPWAYNQAQLLEWLESEKVYNEVVSKYRSQNRNFSGPVGGSEMLDLDILKYIQPKVCSDELMDKLNSAGYVFFKLLLATSDANISSLKFKKHLGRGTYGVVCQVAQRDNTEWALKIQYLANSQARKSFETEIGLLQDILQDCPNICKLNVNCVGITGHENAFGWFLMEYCEGSLNEAIANTKPSMLLKSRKTFWKWSLDIINGLKYLHSKFIMHRDLKPANILLDKVGNCKIADFGLSRNVDIDSGDSIRQQNVKGTKEFLSPEIKRCLDSLEVGIGNDLTENSIPYSMESDIWSYGVVLTQLAIGNQAKYRECNYYAFYEAARHNLRSDDDIDAAFIQKIAETVESLRYVDGNVMRYNVAEDTKAQLGVVLSNCYRRNPEDRMSAAYLKDEVEKNASKPFTELARNAGLDTDSLSTVQEFLPRINELERSLCAVKNASGQTLSQWDSRQCFDADQFFSHTREIFRSQLQVAVKFYEDQRGDYNELMEAIEDVNTRTNSVLTNVFENMVKSTDPGKLHDFNGKHIINNVFMIFQVIICRIDVEYVGEIKDDVKSRYPPSYAAQNASTLSELYNQASQVKPMFDALMEHLVRHCRVQASEPLQCAELKRFLRCSEKIILELEGAALLDSQRGTDGYASPRSDVSEPDRLGRVISTASIASLGSIDSEPVTHRHGHSAGVTKVLDLVRGSIVVESVKEMKTVLDSLLALDPAFDSFRNRRDQFKKAAGGKHARFSALTTKSTDKDYNGIGMASSPAVEPATPRANWTRAISTSSASSNISSPSTDEVSDAAPRQPFRRSNTDWTGIGSPYREPEHSLVAALSLQTSSTDEVCATKLGANELCKVPYTVRVIRVKPRMGSPHDNTLLGDCLINLQILDSAAPAFVCELQIVQRHSFTVRFHMDGHDTYTWVRSTKKLLELAKEQSQNQRLPSPRHHRNGSVGSNATTNTEPDDNDDDELPPPVLKSSSSGALTTPSSGIAMAAMRRSFSANK